MRPVVAGKGVNGDGLGKAGGAIYSGEAPECRASEPPAACEMIPSDNNPMCPRKHTHARAHKQVLSPSQALYMYVYSYVCMHACMFVCVCVREREREGERERERVCVCVCTYIRTYACIHTYIII